MENEKYFHFLFSDRKTREERKKLCNKIPNIFYTIITPYLLKKEGPELPPSSHASTFGGSPICSSAALATFEAIEKEGLLDNAVEMGGYIKERIEDLKKKYPFIKGVKGLALMIGVELDIEGEGIYRECLKRRLLINCTQKKVLRIMPPLVVTKREADEAIAILDGVFAGV